MADITWTDVVDHAAGLSTHDAEAQANILAYVNAHFDVSVLDGEAGPTTKLARVYLAAHLASLEKTSGGSGVGPVQSESGGRLSRSYATRSAGGALSDTSHGRLLKGLLRTSPCVVGWAV